MSRLDTSYLLEFGHKDWKTAYIFAGECLGLPPTSFKQLRDEFDPLHPNARKGWRNRPMRPSRTAIFGMCATMDSATLLELLKQILSTDSPKNQHQSDLPLLPSPSGKVPDTGFAKRIATGLEAEQWFVDNSLEIVHQHCDLLLDCRNLGCGFDFGSATDSSLAFEIKGIRKPKGEVLLTEREWSEASIRKRNYHLVVIGLYGKEPIAKVYTNPVNLPSTLKFQTSIRADRKVRIDLTAA